MTQRQDFALRALVIATVLALVAIAGPADAQRRDYTLDTDPHRLGHRALERGELDAARTHFEQSIADGHELAGAHFGLAQVDVRQGRYEEAEPAFRQALAERGGNYPEAHAGLGLLLLRFGRDLEAKQEFETALAQDDDVWPAHYGLARFYLSAEDWSKAKRELEDGEKRKGVAEGQDLYLHGMALYHLGMGDTKDAETFALRALQMNPADPEYGKLVGRIYEQQGEPVLAINAFEDALAKPGVNATAPTLHALGRLYEETRRFNEAQDRYLSAARTDSTYAPALADLANLYARAEEYDRSARTYLRYVQLVKDDVDALVELARVCIEIRRWGQATEAAQAALALEPTREDARVAFARAGIRSHDDAARAEAAKVLRADPGNAAWTADDLVALATHQTKSKDYDAARATLGRALAKHDGLATAHYQLGLVEMHAGDPPAAMASLRRAVDLDSDQPIFHLNLGIAALQAEDPNTAVDAFRGAVRARDDLVIAHMYLAQTLASIDRVDEARAEYQAVLDAEPENVKALRGLGFCQIRATQYAAAAATYEKATELAPEDAENWAGLGNARLGLDELDASEAAFRRAQSLDPANTTAARGMELLEQARKSNSNRR